MAESLLLKWGTLKGWHVESDKCRELIKRYHELGVSFSCMTQRDTPEQTQIICDLIDAIDGPIENDWVGCEMTKDEAKKYVRDYRKERV
jgi:hypothetical protein